jgi:hypothetical protein
MTPNFGYAWPNINVAIVVPPLFSILFFTPIFATVPMHEVSISA